MTRKRFVKLLMSMGYSRNEANGIAKSAQYCGTPYEREHIKLVVINALGNVACALQNALEKCDGEMQRAAKSITSALAAITAYPAQIIEAAIAAEEESEE